MDDKKPFPIILHVRVPDVLRGCDQRRYIERKLFGYGLSIRPPPMLADTGIPAGYGLVSVGRGCNVIEVRATVPHRAHVIHLHEHELIEDVMSELEEDRRRAAREAERKTALASLPPVDDEDDMDITAGGPMPSPVTMGVIWIALGVLKPLTLIHRGFDRLRRWYVREHS